MMLALASEASSTRGERHPELVVAFHDAHEPEQFVLDFAQSPLAPDCGQDGSRVTIEAGGRTDPSQRSFVEEDHPVPPGPGGHLKPGHVFRKVVAAAVLQREHEQVEHWRRYLLGQELLDHGPLGRQGRGRRGQGPVQICGTGQQVRKAL